MTEKFGTQNKIWPVLQEVPGASTKEIALAIGVSQAAAKNALAKMRNKGLVEVVGHHNDGLGHRMPLWRLT